jgi:hypothetical protein
MPSIYNSKMNKNSPAAKDSDSFSEAFNKAKKSGKKTFNWKGKSYTTKTAEEKAKTLSDKELKRYSEDAYEDAKPGNKAKGRISASYTNEYQYRLGDKMEKKGLNPDKYSDRMKSDLKGGAYAMRRPKRLK